MSDSNKKFLIASTDNQNLQVYAQYNPNQLQFDKNVPWQKTNEGNKPNTNSKPGQGIHQESTGAEGRSLTVELLFDCFESEEKRRDGGVAKEVHALETMASMLDPDSENDDKRRPHQCVVTWGQLEKFKCVIESLSTKYTVFSEDGVPLRATCSLRLKEADVVAEERKKAKAAGGRSAIKDL
jgi:hypothetical protein